MGGVFNMPVEVAQGILNITPSMRGLQALIDREMRGADTRRAGRDAGEGYSSGFGESAKKLTAVLSGAFAAVKIGDFAKDAIAQASDLNEAGSKLQVVFGDATDSVNQFASGGAKAFGQSKLAIQNAAAQFGVYGKAAGLAGSANADFSKNLVGLSTDLASFYNTDPAQAAEAISAGLRGESEPLRQYGVLLDDATLRNKALQLGLITTTKDALTPANKVLAAQASIMEQTTLAQGDFARTSGGLANQQRILAAQWTDMKGKLGQVFLPAVTATVTALNDHLFPVLADLGTKASAAWGVLTMKSGDFSAASAPLGGAESPLVQALLKAHDLYTALGPQLKTAWHTLMTGDTSGVSADEQSPLVRVALMLRDFGLGTFDKLKVIFGNLWATAKDLWPSIQSIAGSISDAVGSLSGAGLGAFTGFLGISEQLSGVLQDTLVPVFDWIAGFMRDNPAVVLTLVGALVAYKVITQAITVATEAWAAIQAVLNAIMDANPITLVVIALAALAAAVVWAYTNVGWFKDAVDAAWGFIKDATSKLWDGVLKPAFTWISENIHVVGDAFTWLWVNAVQPAWEGISAAASWAWEHVIQPIAGLIWAIIQKVGAVYLWLWQEVVVPALQGIGAIISWAWDNVISPIFGFVWDIIQNKVGPAFSWLWNEVVSPVMGWIGGAIKGAWENVIEPVIGWLTQALNDTGGTFSALWATVSDVWTWIQDKINTAWSWLRDNVFSPLNGAISLVGSFFTGMWDTIQTVWNNVSTFFVNVAAGIDTAVTKVKTAITDISTAIDGFFERFTHWGGTSAGGVLGTIDLNPHATGTVVPGYAPGVDNYPALLSPGEAVLVPQLTRQLGASKILEANRRAYMGADGASVLRFAQGGVIGGQQAGDLIYARTKALLDTKQKEMESAVSAATAGGSASVNLAEFNSSQDPSSFGWARAAGIVPYSWAGNSIAGGVAGGTQGLWGALLSALVPQIPGGITSQMFGYENRQNVNSPGNASFHSYGLAVDVNSSANPNGAPGYGRSGQGVIPSGPAHSLAAQYGMLWGGDFSGTPDPMHFEIHLPPSAIGGAVAGTLGQSVASAVVSGSGVERWRATVDQALALTGQPTRYDSIVLHQMDTESSGNPRAINLTDINAQRGDPSKGLLQVIGSTFNRYRLPNLSGDIYDPLANIVAAIRYVLDRYGSIPAGMQGHAYANGGIVPGVGGTDSVRAFLTPGEGVFTKPQTDAIMTHAKALETGFSGQLPPVVINLDNSDPLQVAMAQMIDAGFEGFERSFTRAGAQS